MTSSVEASTTIPLSQFSKALDTYLAMVDLMMAVRALGRPSTFPVELRAAWDACEKVIGEEMSMYLESQAQQARKAGEQLELMR